MFDAFSILQDYTPKGKTENVNGIDTYIVGAGSRVVLMASDLFGMHSGLHKRICDDFADRLPGTTVVLPDFFATVGGSPIPKDAGCCWWLQCILSVLCTCFATAKSFFRKFSWDKSSKAVFEGTIEYLMTKGNVSDIGVIGFCWGSYVVVKASSDSKFSSLMRAGVSCHSSAENVLKFCGDDQDHVLAAISCPQLILSSSNEPKSWQPDGHVIATVKAKFPVSEAHTYKQSHGWVVRGDLQNKAVANDMRDALQKATDFFLRELRVTS